MRLHHKQFYAVASLTLGILLSCVAASEEEYARTDRYTLAKVEARSDQKTPLTTVVTLSFGAEIKTVGEAITELLQGSGYQWVVSANEQGDQLLNTLTLPAIARTLGPIRLEDALTTIAGKAWTLRVDELHRTVSFDIADMHQKIVK